MRYFAKIELDNLVSQVITLSDDISNPEEYLQSLGVDGIWIETWQDGGVRKNFAANGATYDAKLDVFIPKKMQDESDFILDTNTYKWVPPIPYPNDGKEYGWDYLHGSWAEVVLPPAEEAE